MKWSGRDRSNPTLSRCRAKKKVVAREPEDPRATRLVSLKLTGLIGVQGPGRELRITHPESEPQATGPRRSKGQRRERIARRNRNR